MEYFDPMMCGTDNYWKHPLWGFNYTDSVRNFANDFSAYWTLDVVGSYYPMLKKYPFLVITFDVVNEQCTFTAKEDTNQPDLAYQFIPYTDLLVSIKLYLIDGLLLFPSDY